MKKIKFIVLMLMVMFLPLITNAKEVKVYIFEEYNCKNCEDAKEYFDELKTDENYKDKFDVESIEVWRYSNEDDLMQKVASNLHTSYNSFPFIVIGEKYYLGFDTSYSENIRETISNYFESDSYIDVVENSKNEISYLEEKDIDDYYYDNDYDIEYILETIFAIVFGSFAIIFILIGITALMIIIVTKWKVYKKCGKGGWEAIVPIYNNWVFFELSGYSGALSLLGFIPIVGHIALVVFKLIASISFAEKFKLDGVVGFLLVFLPIVGFPMLAFGKYKYDANLGKNRLSN